MKELQVPTMTGFLDISAAQLTRVNHRQQILHMHASVTLGFSVPPTAVVTRKLGLGQHSPVQTKCFYFYLHTNGYHGTTECCTLSIHTQRTNVSLELVLRAKGIPS